MTPIEFAQSMDDVKNRFEGMYASVENIDKQQARKLYAAYLEFMNRLGEGFVSFITMSK